MNFEKGTSEVKRVRTKYDDINEEQLSLLLYELFRHEMYREALYILLKINTSLNDVTQLKVGNFAKEGYLIGTDSNGEPWELRVSDRVYGMMKKCLSKKQVVYNIHDVNEPIFKSQHKYSKDKAVGIGKFGLLTVINDFIKNEMTTCSELQNIRVNDGSLTKIYSDSIENYWLEKMKRAPYKSDVACGLNEDDIPD